MKTNRKPFTLEEYQGGKYNVVTRDGKSVRIVCTDMKSYQPIIAIVRETEDVELYSSFSLNGELHEDGKKDDYDLFLEEVIFEDGDIISFGEIDSSVICIFKNSEKHGYKDHAALTPDNEITYSDCLWVADDIRLATEEEKQRLFDALKKDGKRWNAEKKCVEDIKEYQFKPLDKEVEVFISITLSRNVAIGVNGEINEPNLKKEALKQIDIPGLDSDWCVDDFQVIEY